MSERAPQRVRRVKQTASPFRFPCGHLEPGKSVERRLRLTEKAAWIHCRHCAVIALVVAGGR
jgi:hypothetical protein